MIMDWLEPRIEVRVREVKEYCEEIHRDLSDDFWAEANKIDKSIALKLEQIFVERLSDVIETAYREGLVDGLKLHDGIRTI